MTREHEDMAAALMIEERFGSDGPVYIAEQVGSVALRGDIEGIARWKAIAAAYDSLRQTGSVQ